MLEDHQIAIAVVPWGSCDYRQAVQIRRKELRLPLGLDFSDEELASEQEQIHFVAVEANHVIGCLLLRPVDGAEIKMRQVATQQDRQNSGIGRKMVEFAESWAIDHGYQVMSLHARISVKGFYEKMGYSAIGETFEEVTIPHIKMLKTLPSTMENVSY